MNVTTVSVIVPTYNEAPRIGKLLDVLDHLDDTLYQITVVDDGSTDDTRQVISTHPKLRYICHPSNLGKGAAMATGIENTSGDIILFIDADLIGFRLEQVRQLVDPLLKGTSQASMGYLDNIIDGFFGRPLCGNRAYHRTDLIPLVDEMKTKRYRVEIFLNYHLHHRSYTISRLRKVSQPLQTTKIRGVKGYIKFFNIIWQVWVELFAYRSPVRAIYWSYIQYYFI
ncbi:MAG: glycosyltransferase family 2 protein [Candidatus Roizmanbacteria bacterium]